MFFYHWVKLIFILSFSPSFTNKDIQYNMILDEYKTHGRYCHMQTRSGSLLTSFGPPLPLSLMPTLSFSLFTPCTTASSLFATQRLLQHILSSVQMPPVVMQVVVDSINEDGSIVVNVGDEVGDANSEDDVVGSKVAWEGEMMVGDIDDEGNEVVGRKLACTVLDPAVGDAKGYDNAGEGVGVFSTRTAEFVAPLLSFTIFPLLCGLLFVLS